jgi:SAM-dependent methyltransferase
VDRAETIMSSMAAGVGEPAVQLAQTRFRAGLVDGWGIPVGASVLEIGCGQGDMTAVLADAVGPTGRVVAVDIADPSYGVPVTLGDSAAFLLASPLGARIDMRFQVDVLDLEVTFGADEFDYVVLSHCSWYFSSIEQVDHVLGRIRPWARRLCFAEWDLQPRTLDQVPHLLAVLIQGQIEASGARGDGNVRTPFSRDALLRSLGRTQWQVADSRSVSAATLQDADWEIAACLASAADVGRINGLPSLVRDFVSSQVDVLRSLAEPKGNKPLPSYALVATRA